ncbi:hypothetical protein [Trinickia sp. EG282A]|uniref:hypothetical protein n=1 Tax=Trinickia sp. EG282A TaxID=3237013 RepID=UPI0034D2F1CD
MDEPKSSLYPVTVHLIEIHGALFKRIGAHEADDPDSEDELLLSVVDEDLTEGDLIGVKPLSGGRWLLSHDLANKFGGWPTVWDCAGTESEVTGALATYLMNKR